MQPLTTENQAEPQTTFEAVRHIAELVAAGFDDWSSLGDIRVVRDVDLMLFNYTAAAQYARRWNAYERACRGLIFHWNGRLVARPFDKFFNWGEFGLDASQTTTDAPLACVMEKLDGSMITVFNTFGRWRTATRGSFTSPQAQWAQTRVDALAAELDSIPFMHTWTLIFEAVYPENRVVVDYGGREGLYLLAARSLSSGHYAPWSWVQHLADRLGVPTPVVYDKLDTVEGIRRALDGMTYNEEGFVAVFADESRFKFKSAAYLEMHRAVAGLSFKTAVAAVRDETVDTIRQIVPEELRAEFDGWVEEVRETVATIHMAVLAAMLLAPTGDDRKTFALWVAEQPAWMKSYLFAKRDDKDIRPMIFKKAFEGRGNDDAL